jgi:hypothetical protein
MIEEADELKSEEEEKREALESWALSRVKEWGKLAAGDYDFSSWTAEASKGRLTAGALYESARESHKLRCLLVLMDKGRPREAWEMVRPGNVNGGTPEQADSFACALPFPCSFCGFDEHAAEGALGGFLYCLCDLAGYIADNVSFAELFRSRRDELEKAFGGLDELARVRREHRYFVQVGEAIGVAGASQVEDITTAKTFEKERILLGEAGTEVIAIRFPWGKYSNKEFSDAMLLFAEAYRPNTEACKEPQRKGQRQKEVVLGYLKALAAMRILKRFEGNQWKRLSLIADVCRYSGCVKESVEYERRRAQGHCDEPMGKAAQVAMTEARDHALSLFQSIFKGELPSNY